MSQQAAARLVRADVTGVTPEALAAIAAGVVTLLAARLVGITGGATWYATWLGIFVSANAFVIVFALRGMRRQSREREQG